MNKHLLTISDLDKESIEEIFKLSDIIKDKQKSGITYHPLAGKVLGMIFKKPSTRTRVSFSVGMYQLGGESVVLNAQDIHIDRGETLHDTSRIFSLYLDGLMIRTFDHSEVDELAKYSSIPIINGLTDFQHPCQIVSDLYTIKSKFNKLEGIKVCYIGDGNNIVNSLIEGCALFGVDFTISVPVGYEPDSEVLRKGKESVSKMGGSLSIERDPIKAAEGANIVYTDVWASMGQESEIGLRKKVFKQYQINNAVINNASKDVLVMHCLPAHRGEEITPEVIDGEKSIVFEQAENRLYVQKAILEIYLGMKNEE